MHGSSQPTPDDEPSKDRYSRRTAVVAARVVWPAAEIFVTSSNGIVIRMETDSISRQKRDATGVKVMDVEGDASIASFTLVPPEETETAG